MQQTLVRSVGVDVSKFSLSTALLADDHSSQVRSFANTNKGIDDLLRHLDKQMAAATVPFVIEATGDYHLRCALAAAEAGRAVSVINPIITKAYRRTSIRNSKDDSVDALRLARIGVQEPSLTLFRASKQAIFLKKVASSLGRLSTYKQQLEAHLRQLIEAQELLGIKVDLASLKKAIRDLDKQIETFEHYVGIQAPAAAARLSAETRGLSKTRCAMLLAKLEGKNFANRDQLTAFVGFDVAARRSGTWRGKERISKRGDPHLRKILFQIAWGLKQHNAKYRAYYEQLRARGKHYFTCLIAVARKFLRYLFVSVWKTPVPAA